MIVDFLCGFFLGKERKKFVKDDVNRRFFFFIRSSSVRRIGA